MDIRDIIKPENKVYGKSSVLTDNIMHYCPGCSHGVVHKLVAQVIEEMDIQDKTIGVSPVGCSVFAYNYLTSTGRKPPMEGLRPWPQPSSASIPTNTYSPTRATATSLRSAPPKRCTPATVARTSSSSSSTMPSTA